MIPKYKTGDLIQIRNPPNVYLVIDIEYDSFEPSYSLLTTDGKQVWKFCSSIDKNVFIEKVN